MDAKTKKPMNTDFLEKLEVFQDLMKRKKSKGVGDSIEKVAEATGIKQLVEATATAVGVKDCGCKNRRDKLNKLFPYKNN